MTKKRPIKYKEKVIKDGEDMLSIGDAARKADISYNCCYVYYNDHGARTFEAIESLRDTKGHFNPVAPPVHETKYGPLNIHEIYDIHPFRDNVNKPMLSTRISVHGGMSERLWEDRRINGSRRRKKANTFIKIKQKKKSEAHAKAVKIAISNNKLLNDFDRNVTCVRGAGLSREKCINYTECANIRAYSGRHGDLYEESGQCFKVGL